MKASKQESDILVKVLFNYWQWFSGETSIFGGIEYDLKKYGLRFKLEYDTTNPDEMNLVIKSL